MSYRRKTFRDYNRPSRRKSAEFSGSEGDDITRTSLPTATASWILDSIEFTKLVNEYVEWDPLQCKISPGDALKAMILTMVMGGYRPSLEAVHARFGREPVDLYFETVEEAEDLSPDILARTLSKLYEADPSKLFMTVSAAMRGHWGLKTRAVHSDTTSVSVQGNYDVYDDDGNLICRKSDGTIDILDDGALVITRGYSKDHRPDLKQYGIGEVVDENGLPVMMEVLNGNESDHEWNRFCLGVLKEMLLEEHLIYVADSKVVTDPLVTSMLDDGLMFLSRCPANFNEKLLVNTMMSFDLDELVEIPNVSERRGAASRRICETKVPFKGRDLRAILVETSTLAGKGEHAVEREIKRFEDSLEKFEKVYNCQPDAVKAFERFQKKAKKSILDVTARYDRSIVERRPVGRPRKDGTDILRSEQITVTVEYSVNPERAEALRRREGYIMLLSNVPSREDDAELGMTAEELVRLYASEWRVEAMFKTKKRPMLVERLFIKDPRRAEALVNVVCMAAMVRGMMQILLRAGIAKLSDDELPRIGDCNAKVKRNITADHFIDRFSGIELNYYPSKGTYKVNSEKAEFVVRTILGLMGIPPNALFSA